MSNATAPDLALHLTFSQKPITLKGMKTQEIADFLSAELVGEGNIEIERVAALATASNAEIAFIEKTAVEFVTKASCLIVPLDYSSDNSLPYIRTPDPKLAFARVAGQLHPPKTRVGKVHPSAVIAENSKIGADVFIGAFTCVGENSTIGDGTHLRAGAKVGDNVTIGRKCVLHPNVFIEDGCTVGDNVVLHAGVVIGADGFGYVRLPSLEKEGWPKAGVVRSLAPESIPMAEERTTPSAETPATPPPAGGELIKFPQIGTVVIEDNVEIGANSCIDRGALGETRIGMGTKIDNLVQIAHNVQIGKRVIIAAQTGISGSTVIEDDCVIGGQVGMGDHALIKSGAVIGSQAGVLPGKIVRPGVWWGTPVQPLDEYKRQNAHVKGLARLKGEIKQLREQIAALRIRD